MKIKLATLLLTAAAMFGFGMVSAAKASETDQKTMITVTGGSIQVPGGVVLPPGEYMVKRIDRDVPDVIGIWNADGTHLFTTTRTVPVERAYPSGNVRIGLQERPGNAPVALKNWTYPGNTTGEQFLYPAL